jgi:uncharacterized protein with PIN domain/sulfur carrier protein ThiS
MGTRGHAGTAHLRFYAELNDFLPAALRQHEFERPFDGRPAVKDLIESAGVPHTEVDVILVNGVPVGFEHPVEDGDRIAVYPVFEALDISAVQHLRPAPLRETRFILDGHLGKLARALRLLGFDCEYQPNVRDAALIEGAIAGRRIILTRDRELLKTKRVTHGYWIRSTDPARQIVEVLDRFDLRGSARPFTRCTVCNGPLVPVAFENVASEVPPRVRENQRDYTRCSACRKIYWKGTHVTRLEAFVERVLSSGA